VKLAWVTDPHIDFCSEGTLRKFYKSINEADISGVLITGDISNNSEKYLPKIEANIRWPIYFVLGNHDFYGSSFEKVRKLAVSELFEGGMYYLSTGMIVELGPGTCLIGHDGWYDARLGETRSNMEMNDW